ncbi:MAG: glycosyltransferase family 4 protein [Clostridiaceae bacterium]
MKKILILANFHLGLYNFRKELIASLMEKGHEVYISLPYGPLVENLKEMGCRFYDTELERRGLNPFKDLKLMKDYTRLIKEIKPHLVITYTIKPNIYGGMACRLAGIPYMANITGLGTAFQKEGPLKELIKVLYRLSLKKARAVLFENIGNKEVFLQNSILDDSRCRVMNGAGVNIDEYCYTPLPERQMINFLFIGRIMKEKGVDELFKAASKIKSEYENVQFSVVGPFEDHYENKVKELEQEGIIRFHGYQKDVKPFVKGTHCFVLPSYHEGMANTLLECAAMGRPLIASDINGCREAVIDGENGFLCSAGDWDSLYVKMKQFIELPHEKKIQMGISSRVRAEDCFDRKKVVSKTLDIIDDIRW